MHAKLYHYLLERYEDGRGNSLLSGGAGKGMTEVIQIDDQDDCDSLTEFCNIYCTVTSAREMRLELYGKFPITREMTDLAAAHEGFVDRVRGRLVMKVTVDAAEVVYELAHAVKATARMGAVAGNPVWLRVSARTVSSLLRFGRVLQEYSSTENDDR